METSMLYLAKSVIISGIVFCFYSLFLKKEPFHQSNRFFLIIGAFIAVIIPLIDFNFLKISLVFGRSKHFNSEISVTQTAVVTQFPVNFH